MMDEIYDRGYQAGRAELHAGIDRLVHRIANSLAITFDAIHRIEWDAPWDKQPKSKC